MKAKLMAVALAATTLMAQDSRNTNVPNTDTHVTMPEYKTLADWEARRKQLREHFLSAAGLNPMPEKTPLNPRIFGHTDHKDYTIDNVVFETMPGFYLGGNLYKPKGKTGKLPGLLIAHGHWIYGRLENQQLDSMPTQGVNMARQGYIVFAYDMIGYNDTAQLPHEFDGKPERLWTYGVFGLQSWNSIRALDYLESLSEVDHSRMGITGASGGATQAMVLSALDDRVAFSSPVNMISASMQGGCICENAYCLRRGTSNLELAAMMAPKPMLVVAATGDWTKNVPREEFPAIRHIWELYGKADNIEAVQFNLPHNYNKDSREAVYAFFAKHVLSQTQPPKEKEVEAERIQDMLAFFARPMPANALTADKVFEQWKEMSRRQSKAITDPEAIRARLRFALAAEWPEKVEFRESALYRSGAGDHVPARWTVGQGDPVLYLHPDGAAAAAKSPAVTKLLADHRSVLLIDAFQTGSAKAPRDRNAHHFLTFNVTDDAARVQDILTAARFLMSTGAKRVEIAGEGNALVWALFAAAIAPEEIHLSAMPTGFTGSDKDFATRFYVPGLQRAGGLDAAMKLVQNKH